MAISRAGALQVISPVLTNLARQYKPHGFIADEVLANIPVQTLAGQYPVFTKQEWFSNFVDNLSKDREAAKEVDITFSTEAFLAKEYALKISITDLERAQAHPGLRLEASKLTRLMQAQALAKEVRVAALLRDVTNGGGFTASNETAISTKWDLTTSNPEADIRAAALSIYNATGLQPNTIVIPYPVAYNLATIHGTDTFRGQMLYTVNGAEAIRIGAGVLPSEIHGMRVLIPTGPQVNTQQANTPAASYTEIWGKHVRLLYVDKNAEWGIPSVAYNFQHTPVEVFRWRQNDPDIDYIRVKERVDERVVAPDTGWVLSDCIS